MTHLGFDKTGGSATIPLEASGERALRCSLSAPGPTGISPGLHRQVEVAETSPGGTDSDERGPEGNAPHRNRALRIRDEGAGYHSQGDPNTRRIGRAGHQQVPSGTGRVPVTNSNTLPLAQRHRARPKTWIVPLGPTQRRRIRKGRPEGRVTPERLFTRHSEPSSAPSEAAGTLLAASFASETRPDTRTVR